MKAPNSAQESQVNPHGFVTVEPSGADDTVALAAAIKTGRPVRLLPGNYTTDVLPKLRSGSGIVGDGSQLTRLRRKSESSPGSLITIADDATRFVLRGFWIDGNRDENASGGAIFSNRGSDFLIEDVCVSDDASTGIALSDINPGKGHSLARILRVQAIRCGGNGVVIAGYNNLDIAECQFSCNQASGLAFTTNPSRGLMLRNCWATDNLSHGIALICVVDGNPVELEFTGKEAIISQCYAARNQAYGIIAQVSRGVLGTCIAVENGLNGGHFPGLSGILANSDNVAIVGNGSFDNTADGIDIGSANCPVVVGNICDTNGYYGVEASSTSGGVVVGNSVTGSFHGDPSHLLGGASGIFHGVGNTEPGRPFANPPTGMMIGANRVTGGPNQQYGIFVEPGTTDALVVGNWCLGAASEASFPNAVHDVFINPSSGQDHHNSERPNALSASEKILGSGWRKFLNFWRPARKA